MSKPIKATVVSGDENRHQWTVAEPSSLDGKNPLHPLSISPKLTRKLVKVDGTSIKWFGVVVPRTQSEEIMGGVPHIFFTPPPRQGGYEDSDYDQFTAWKPLWDTYTSTIGSQLVHSQRKHILVIPFYKQVQYKHLGKFLENWKEVVTQVITVALDSINPYYLREYRFNQIFSSSFSGGIYAHKNFYDQGVGASSLTKVTFDLDGQWAGAYWRPSQGITYLSYKAKQTNPAGRQWFVGGRFADIRRSYPGTNDHDLCHLLLLHGLTKFGG